MHIDRYNHVRSELIRLYKLFSERTFRVHIPLSSFMTLKQLEHLEAHPPITGFETLNQTVERPYTIRHLLTAVNIRDSEFTVGFSNPRQDIPVIYKSIEDWILYWIEIKSNADYFATPSIEELEIVEKLGRYLFSAYAHYYHEKINTDMNVRDVSKLTLIDILKGKMVHGDGWDEPISYVSHLDLYKQSIGYNNYNSRTGDTSHLDFLKGFGGGL